MWGFILLCTVISIGLYLYNPQKVKQKFYEKTKSNTDYVFITLYFIVGIAILVIFVILLINNANNILSKLGI